MTSLDTWNKSLNFFGYVVDNDVVTTGVSNYLVIQEEDVVLDVTLDTKEEAGLNYHS